MADQLNCCRIVCDGDASISFTGDGEQGNYMAVGNYPKYEGPYEVTPSQEAQTLDVTNMVCTEDIVVNKIPDNYGLITWNGYSLRVS